MLFSDFLSQVVCSGVGFIFLFSTTTLFCQTPDILYGSEAIRKNPHSHKCKIPQLTYLLEQHCPVRSKMHI